MIYDNYLCIAKWRKITGKMELNHNFDSNQVYNGLSNSRIEQDLVKYAVR